MISDDEYNAAKEQRDQAEQTMRDYHRQKAQEFQLRFESGEPFTDDELFYSARHYCPCGHGLAYPKGCGPSHYWDCSAILKGIADENVQHTGQLPFVFYDVKGESEHNGTTRGKFQPKPTE